MRLNLLQAKIVQVFNGRSQSNSVGDVRRPGLKPVGQAIVDGLLECHRGDHVPAALVRRHGLQQLGLSVQQADAGGPIHLVAGNGIKIAIQRLHVHPHVRRGLRPVHQHGDVARVGHAHDLAHRIDRPQRIREMPHADHLRLRPQQLFKFLQQQLASDLRSGRGRAWTASAARTTRRS